MKVSHLQRRMRANRRARRIARRAERRGLTTLAYMANVIQGYLRRDAELSRNKTATEVAAAHGW